jgi:hypothetical protein
LHFAIRARIHVRTYAQLETRNPSPFFFPSFFRGLKSAATPGRIANVSMSLFHLLRLDIQQENVEIAVEQQQFPEKKG